MRTSENQYPLLQNINFPEDVKKLTKSQLPELAEEIRRFLIESLDFSGGHFASSMGALELTIALHYVYHAPTDNIVWDVGHQAYVHKILTGRKDQLHSIKKPGGLCGFPNRFESKYDVFGVGHAGTSISAALGMTEAVRLAKSHARTVAVIGDGAMTAGMAFEALNHAGGIHADMLVILNENDMSISENVGGLREYFARFLSGSTYAHFRHGSKKLLSKLPAAWDIAKKLEAQAKGMIVPANLFESFGFYYAGPIDGHDSQALVDALVNLKNQKGPRLLHIITQKGKGYEQAEADPIKYHHVKPNFDSSKFQSEKPKNEQKNQKPAKLAYANVFGHWLCDKAEHDSRLVGITPAMREGSDLLAFSRRFPQRYYDAAIAEQHAVTLTAGMATQGRKPVLAIYSTFLQRAYDQVIHDVSIQALDVLLAIDRAGLVGADGPTHAGSFDISMLYSIPGFVVMTPSDEHECYHMLTIGYEHPGPAAVRYPRGTGIGQPIEWAHDIVKGHAKIKKTGERLAILAFGAPCQYAMEAGEKLNATVVDMRFVKPLDTKTISEIVVNHDYIITIEEAAVKGSAGAAVNEFLINHDLHHKVKIRNKGLPDYYQAHGVPEQMLNDVGLSCEGIIATYKSMLPVDEKI